MRWLGFLKEPLLQRKNADAKHLDALLRVKRCLKQLLRARH
jgi:hypothetical protein